MSQYDLGKNIPHATGKLEVFLDSSNFRIAETPAKIDHWIYTDAAQPSLQIINFAYATFVTITWLHTLLDAMGRHALLYAWQSMLEGREEDVPEFVGFESIG